MIHLKTKRYQLVLWDEDDRGGAVPALKLEFDTLAQASEEFQAQQKAARYGAGLLFQWLKDSDDWELVDRYPR